MIHKFSEERCIKCCIDNMVAYKYIKHITKKVFSNVFCITTICDFIPSYRDLIHLSQTCKQMRYIYFLSAVWFKKEVKVHSLQYYTKTENSLYNYILSKICPPVKYQYPPFYLLEIDMLDNFNEVKTIVKNLVVDFPHLTSLKLEKVCINSCSDFDGLSTLTNLVDLSIFNVSTVTEDRNFAFLNYTRELRSLDLCGFRGSMIKTADYISANTKLEKLFLRSMNTDDEWIKKFTKIKGLKNLAFDSGITGRGLAQLHKFKYLARLYMIDMNVNDSDMRVMSQLKSLRKLSICCFKNITDETFVHISEMVDLESLNMIHCERILCYNINVLSKTRIKKIDLSRNFQLSSQLFEKLLKINTLTKVKMTQCPNITEKDYDDFYNNLRIQKNV